MSSPKTIVQKIVNVSGSILEKAVKYYSIMSVLNNIHLTPREIQLLAFMSLRGTISTPASKAEFERLFSSPRASIGNMVWKLTNKGILVRNEENDVVINPHIRLNFNDVLVLNITLTNGSE